MKKVLKLYESSIIAHAGCTVSALTRRWRIDYPPFRPIQGEDSSDYMGYPRRHRLIHRHLRAPHHLHLARHLNFVTFHFGKNEKRRTFVKRTEFKIVVEPIGKSMMVLVDSEAEGELANRII